MSVSGQVSRSSAGTWLRRAASRIEAAARHLLRPARLPSPRIAGRQLALILAVSAVLFVISMFVFDVRAITWARSLPAFIVAAFREITDFGKSGWFLWPLGFFILALAIAPPNLPRSVQVMLAAVMVRAGFLFIAIGLPSLVGTIIKRIIGRGRPFVGGSANAFVFDPFNAHAAYASLPSGHATTAFAAAVAIGALWPRSQTVMWVYALLICLSRVIVTAHHPSDVLAGALLGGFGALFVRNYFAARRLGFGVDAEGAVHAFPGPSRRRAKAVARALLSE
jgi:undecaprenyl-diphosphatase